MHSIIRNKQAFTAIEALVGFILFSSMMLLYLPALTQSIQTYHQLNTQTKQWQLLYDLYQLHSIDEAENNLIQTYHHSYHPQIIDYYLSETDAMITFADQSQLTVSLVDIR